VGISVETIALHSLDQNTPYDFLNGQTPAQRIAEMKEQRQWLKESMVDLNMIYPIVSDAELSDYIERVKTYGEVPAMRWLREQHPEAVRNPSQ